MSNIAALRAELSRQESINRELRAQLNEIYQGVSRADQSLTSFRNAACSVLETSTQRIQASHQRILSSIEVQADIDRMYVRFKQMELANKKIRACNNKKYYDFANYRTVRKIVRGILDNLTLTEEGCSLVSDGVIYKSVERQHLQNPDYWLTCALLSVMAWQNDDRDLADRALARAVELDKKSASIFYMLFNLRLHREEAALKWFFLYQECDFQGSDQRTFLMLFALLSQAIRESTNTRTRGEVQKFIRKVIADNARAAGFRQADVVSRIAGYLAAMAGSDPLELPLLQRCCGDYQKIARAVTLAQNNVNILQFLMDLANVSREERNTYLATFLEELIDAPNPTEKSVYEEIEYNELIIRCKGEVDQAKEIWAKEQKRREGELDLISEMMGWVYGSAQEVNGQSRKNMFSLTLELQQKGYAQYVEQYRALASPTHPVTIGDYETVADFNDREGERQKISAFYQQQLAQELAQVKNWPAYLAFGVGAAAAVGGVLLSPALFVATLAGCAAGGLLLWSNARRRRHLQETCTLNIQGKNELMDQLFAQYGEMVRQFSQYDGYVDQVNKAFMSF